jgi:two-component system osmolarity sensor histidine kinase EnvZ
MTLWPRTLLWRTVLLLALLLVTAQAAWFLLSGVSDREARARQIAQYTVSLANLTRSALAAAEPGRRRQLLRELSEREGVRIFSAADRTPEPVRLEMPIVDLIRRQVQDELGPGTEIVVDRARPRALWVSLDIEGARYWLVLSRTRVERPFPWRWVAWGAAVLVLAVAGAYLIVDRVNRPLRRLTAAAAALGRGEQPELLPEDGPAELRSLTRTFNQMAADLARLEADRTLLLAGVSHDLRTPLSRLRIAAEMLPDDHTKAGLIQDVEDMDAIIGQFLAFVREGEGEARTETDLNEIVRAVGERFARGGHRIETELTGLPRMHLRPTAIHRMIANLVDNALKHGHRERASAEVRIQTWLRDGHACVSVLDRGPGIPEDEIARLKKPFTRLDTARSRAPGSGLGLAVVERIARAHGGRLLLQSRAGGGLEARVELPVQG